MDAIMKQVGSFVSGVTSLVVSLIGLSVAIEVVFGASRFGSVIGNITSIVGDLSSGGFVGLLVLLILWSRVK